MVKQVFRIDAWCLAKDEATMNAIFNSLLSDLQTQKANGNIIDGNVTKNIREELERTGYSENI